METVRSAYTELDRNELDDAKLARSSAIFREAPMRMRDGGRCYPHRQQAAPVVPSRRMYELAG
jgi:hypothetical protein